MKNEIMVSVICLAYNHEKYLRQCLDGFVNQKTNFRFEVLVHDDASTDNSAEIIREYEEKYPEIIKPIYQTENQYSKKVGILKTYQYPRVKGKYIAYCEGDDYWTDENKLQGQFDALEGNPDCGICVHNVRCVNEDGSPNNREYPEFDFQEGVIKGSSILNLYPNWIFHLTSFFVKSELVFELQNQTNLINTCPAGDMLFQYFCAANTNYYYIDYTMSSYRVLSKDSWTAKLREDEQSFFDVSKRFQEFTEQFMIYYNDEEFNEIGKQAIKQYEIQVLLKKKKYKKIYSLRDSKYFIQLNNKQKAVIYLSKFLPGFELFYNSIYKKRKGKSVIK